MFLINNGHIIVYKYNQKDSKICSVGNMGALLCYWECSCTPFLFHCYNLGNWMI